MDFHEAMETPDITPNERLILLALVYLGGTRTRVNASGTEIAKVTGLNRGTVSRMVNSLESRGVLAIHRTSHRAGNTYELQPLASGHFDGSTDAGMDNRGVNSIDWWLE